MLNKEVVIETEHDKKGSKAPIAIAIAVGAILLLAAIYIGTALAYYSAHFLPNTSIESVNVSGLDVSEASAKISERMASAEVRIEEDGKDALVLTGEEIGLSPVAGEMDDALTSQDEWKWPLALLGAGDDRSIGIQYSIEKIEAAADDVIGDADKRQAPVSATIAVREDGNGFETVEAVEGTQIERDALIQSICDCAAAGGGTVDVRESYVKPKYTSESDEVKTALEKANSVANKTVSYNIDGIESAETLTREQIMSFVTIDPDSGALAADKDAIKTWLREMGKKYDTTGEKIRYTTAYGKKATLPTGVIGWITDEAGMVDVVEKNLLEDSGDVKQDFKYKQDGLWAKGAVPDFGDKYVDIDLTDQKVRLIENGKVTATLTTVTGSNDGRHNTPVGAWKIDFKAAPYVMVGSDENGDGRPDYSTPTQCFAHFRDGCALHEMSSRATWDSKAWLRGAGSHGCANLKRDDAWKAYNFVDYGTPVLVHK